MPLTWYVTPSVVAVVAAVAGAVVAAVAGAVVAAVAAAVVVAFVAVAAAAAAAAATAIVLLLLLSRLQVLLLLLFEVSHVCRVSVVGRRAITSPTTAMRSGSPGCGACRVRCCPTTGGRRRARARRSSRQCTPRGLAPRVADTCPRALSVLSVVLQCAVDVSPQRRGISVEKQHAL
jgi:hypothetical protein